MKRGNKILYMLFACSMAVLPMLWPQTISKAQVTVAGVDISLQQKADSLSRERTRVLDSALSLAKMLPGMSSTLTKYVKNRKSEEKLKVFSKPQVVVRYNGEIYEPDVQGYKNYLIVDVDSFLSDIKSVEDSIFNKPAEMNEFVDTSFYEPKPKAPWWKIWKK